jgi:hypothetical protein
MDKIEKYRNLNEQVNRILKKEISSTLAEDMEFAAQELVEALEDPNRVTMLMRSGLIDSGRVARVRTALKDPEKAMKNVSVRSDLINMLMSLINIITSNPAVFATVKKGAKNLSKEADKGAEEMTEESDGYKKFFQAALKKFGKSSIAEMTPEEKKKFFTYVEDNYKGENPATNDGDM